MKKTINSNEFINEFVQYDRKDNFSNIALNMLYDYFIEIEEDTATSIELDVIAICCEYCEYTFIDLKDDYSHLLDDDIDNNDIDEIIDILSSNINIVNYDIDKDIYIVQE